MKTQKFNPEKSQAEIRLRDQVFREPEESSAKYELAMLLHVEGRFQEMVEILEELIAHEPGRALTHFLLAMAWGKLGKTKKYREENAAAVKLVLSFPDEPGKPAAQKERVGRNFVNPELEAFKEMYPGDPNFAEVKYYEKLAQQNKASYEQTFLLGLAYKRLGWQQAAVTSFQQVLKLNPKYDEAYFELGNLFKQMGKWQEAAKAYRRALELNPEAAEPYFQLGLVCLQLKRDSEARQLYQQLLPLDEQLAERLREELR